MDNSNPFDAVVAQQPDTSGNPFDSVVGNISAPAPAANPFDQVVQDENRKAFLETLKNSKDIVPERQARAIEVAKLQGLPVGVAYKHLEELQPQPVAADYDSLTHKAPATARLLADPIKGPVAFPDAQHLGDIEQSLKAFTTQPSIKAEELQRHATDTALSSLLSYFDGLGKLSPEDSAVATEANQRSRAEALAASQAATAAQQAQQQQQEQGAAAGFADFEAQRGNPGAPDPMALPKPYADARKAMDERAARIDRSSLDLALKNPVTEAYWRNLLDSTASGALSLLTSSSRAVGAAGDIMAGELPAWLKPYSEYTKIFPGLRLLFTPPSDLDAQGRSSFTRAADMGDSLISKAFPGDVTRQNDFSSMLANGAGSIVAFGTVARMARAFGLSADVAASVLGALSQGGQNVKDAQDNGASPVVQLLSLAAGEVSGATEGWVGWDRILSGFPDATTFMQKIADIGITAAKEGSQEFSQQLISDTVPVLTYDKARDVFGNAFWSGLVGALTGGGMSAVTVGAHAVSEWNHQRVLALGDAASKAKILDHAPAIVNEHVQQLVESGNAPAQVTAPAEAVDTLFQEVAGENLDQLFPKTAQSLREAKATGAEVTIPTEELVRLGKLKGYGAFAADVRVGDDLTLNEATKLREDVASYLKEQGAAETPAPQAESPIYTDIRDQLVKAGQSLNVATAQARLMDAFFQSQSERTGVPAHDLARRYGVEVSNSALGEAAGKTTLAQAQEVPDYRPTAGVDYAAPLNLVALKEASAGRGLPEGTQGREFHLADGSKVTVSGTGVRKMHRYISATAGIRKAVLANFGDVVAASQVFAEAPDSGGNTGKNWRYAASRVVVGGKEYLVRLSLEQTSGASGEKVYALHGFDAGSSGVAAGALGRGSDNPLSPTGGIPVATAVQASAPTGGKQGSEGLNLQQALDFFKSHPQHLFQGGKDVRGSITFGPLRDKFHITLTEKANLSTFLHEGGHFFLEVLQDLVARGEASAQQVADLKTLKKWMGVEDGQQIDRAGHEKFARSFEQYLMEGKAPSLALHGIFQKFKAWMIFVYKRLANVQGGLSDDIRTVMDRLVASDAAIAEARTLVGWRGQPMSQEETGLTDAEYKAYTAQWTKANDAQAADADARIMLEAARELKKTWAEEKAKVTREVEAEVHSTRGWTAWKLLESGQGLEDFGRSTLKLDPETVPKEWRGDTRGMTAPADQGGMPFDAVAEMLGFETGEEMMRMIGGARLAEKAIGARVRQIMTERHGEMDAAALSQEAMKAVHNTPTMDILLTEFRALAAKANLKVGKDTKRLIAAAAEERVAKLTSRQLDPSKWRRAEVKAAEEAGKLAAKGKDMEAALAKRRQLMAAAMAKASLEAQDGVERMKDYLATFTTNRRRAALGKAGQTYLDAVDQILEGVQLKDVTLKAIAARQSLADFVKAAEANGDPVFISEETRALLGRKNYTELTVEEMVGVHDAVKNLWTLAKEATTLRKGAEKIALENALADITKETEELLPVIKKRDHLNPSKIDRMAKGISRYTASLLKAEFVFDWMGKTAHSLLFQPIVDAQFKAWQTHRDLTAPFMDRLRAMPKEQRLRWNTKRQFLNYPMPLKGANIWTIALNLGNASNKEKLLMGYGWTESEVRAALDQFMTKEDWDLVQETWDTIEKMWPEMSRVVQKATGLTPPKIEATPIETRFGTYRGGYFPVVYDTQIDSRMDDLIDNSISPEEMFSKRFTAFVMNNGFTKGRTKVTGKLLLSPDIIADHLGEVIHYTSHYEAVKQVDKVLRNPQFKALVKDHLGDEVYKQLKVWLENVATNTTQKKGWEFGDSAFRWMRNSAQLTSLGFNLKSALKQPLGIVATADAIGPVYLSKGIAAAWLSPNLVRNWKDAFAKSKELPQLVKGYDRDLAAISRAYADKIGNRAWEATYNAAFMPISVMQSVANVAAWHGGYAQALDQGMSETDAVNYADKVVRTTQGSGAMKDLAGAQRGGETTKFLTMFYSYFSVVYNRMADIQTRERGLKNLHRKAARYTVLLLMGELLNTLADDAWQAMFPPDKKQKEDDTPFLARLALNTVDSAVNSLPGVRDVYSATQAIITGDVLRPPPGIGAVNKAAQGAKAIVDVTFKGKDMTRAKARNMAALVGMVTGTPTYGVYRVIDDVLGATVLSDK